MEHFADEVWADYARGVATQQTQREIEAHLPQCADCKSVIAVWRGVQTIANREPEFAPPDSALRLVKQELATGGFAEPKWTLANLVFDSFSQPLTVGVRSGASAARQLLFDAEGTVVHLVLDHPPQAHTVSLVGQVTDKGGAIQHSLGVKIVLWTANGQPLAEASANELGEFQMEFAPQDQLHLSVEIVGRKPIRIQALSLAPKVTTTITKSNRDITDALTK